MVSAKNAKITHLADVVINSLTKYAGWEGDVMMGSLAFPDALMQEENFMRKPVKEYPFPFQRSFTNG